MENNDIILPYIDPSLPFERRLELAYKYRTRFGSIQNNESFYKIEVSVSFRKFTLRPSKRATLEELQNKINEKTDIKPINQCLFHYKNNKFIMRLDCQDKTKTMQYFDINEKSRICVVYKSSNCKCQNNSITKLFFLFKNMDK